MLKQITVKDYMASNVITLSPEMGVSEAIKLFLSHRISGAPVVNNTGEILGLLSEKDCLKVIHDAAYHESMDGKVADYMSTDIKSVPSYMGIVEVSELFINHSYRRFPVLEGNKVVGQISRRDVLKALDAIW